MKGPAMSHTRQYSIKLDQIKWKPNNFEDKMRVPHLRRQLWQELCIHFSLFDGFLFHLCLPIFRKIFLNAVQSQPNVCLNYLNINFYNK